MKRCSIVILRLSFLCGAMNGDYWGSLLRPDWVWNNRVPEKSELPPPWVTVSSPVERMVPNYEYARGRCEPLEQVQIRARVSGYLNKIDFEQGREVEKGKLLYRDRSRTLQSGSREGQSQSCIG